MSKKKWTAIMHNVQSSNLERIGFQKGYGPNDQDTLRVEFSRGGIYEYYGVTEQQYREGLASDKISEWFKTIKTNPAITYKEIH